MKEEWRMAAPTALFYRYQVSSRGRVRWGWSFQIIAGTADGGARHVQLSTDAGIRKVAVARLVLTTFDRSPKAGEIVVFKDGNRSRATRANLRWGTKAEAAKGAGRHKLTPERAAELRALKGTMSTREAGEKFGVNKSTVSKVWRGESYGQRERKAPKRRRGTSPPAG